MEFLPSPLRHAFHGFLDDLNDRCLICSPYITREPTKELVSSIRQRKLEEQIDVTILTDISLTTLLQGATDLTALIYIKEAIRNAKVFYLPNIHAKVFVAGDTSAIVGSANFTSGGYSGNLEYAVRFDARNVVMRIESDIREYVGLGSQVSLEYLRQIEAQIEDLRLAISKEQKSINAQIRRATDALARQTEENLLRARIGGRSIHAIFAETIEYLLRQKAMSTAEIHLRVKGIHPDLCDEAVDRVIDGQRFGKLWKHQIRTAQQHLKRSGRITYDKAKEQWRHTAQGHS